MKTKSLIIPLAMLVLLSAGCAKNSSDSPNINTNRAPTNEIVSNGQQNNEETYTSSEYKFSVEYPKGYGPYEYKENTDALLDLYFTEKESDGTVAAPDYGVMNYFSISIYNSSVDAQVKKYTNEIGFTRTTQKINNNNFTIIEYKIASIPGSKELEIKKLAILQNNNNTFIIHPYYTQNLDTILASFKLIK